MTPLHGYISRLPSFCAGNLAVVYGFPQNVDIYNHVTNIYEALCVSNVCMHIFAPLTFLQNEMSSPLLIFERPNGQRYLMMKNIKIYDDENAIRIAVEQTV